jgi:hypothetical protein
MSKPIIVQDRFRKNDLSVIPGGETVTTIYANGESRVYKNIKNPSAYCKSLIRDTAIIKVLVGNLEYWVRK